LLNTPEWPEAERGDSLLYQVLTLNLNRAHAQVQSIFCHLLLSRAQHFAPEGFWKAYRHWGEPVSLREQQDAREFLDNLIDQGSPVFALLTSKVDENLKKLGLDKALTAMTNGVYTDLKSIKAWYNSGTSPAGVQP
jgi:hypothetical protein